MTSPLQGLQLRLGKFLQQGTPSVTIEEEAHEDEDSDQPTHEDLSKKISLPTPQI